MSYDPRNWLSERRAGMVAGSSTTSHWRIGTWLAAPVLVLLTACTTPPLRDIGDTPASFHDTRLQYALLTGDRHTLREDFSMQTEPTVPERLAAGLVLPITAATETVFWPLSASFRAYHERY